MHEVPRLCTKLVRGFRERVQDWTKARITKTARTPTDKSVWGISKSGNTGYLKADFPVLVKTSTPAPSAPRADGQTVGDERWVARLSGWAEGQELFLELLEEQ